MKLIVRIILLSFFVVTSCWGQPAVNTNAWQISLGIMSLTVPKFQGADVYRSLLVPNIDMKYKQWFFVNAYRGIGVNVINNKQFTLGTSLRYNYGGDNERGERFPGLDNTNDTFQAGIFAQYRISLFSFGLSTYRAIGALQGSGYYSPSLGFFLPLSRRFFINFSISARYDDANYMEALFGVNQVEAQASGLPIYKAHAGWQNVSYAITPIWRLSKRWTLSGIFSAKNFSNQSLASPVIDHGTTYFAGVSLTRLFA